MIEICNQNEHYRVKKGDDLASISKQFNVGINSILRNNPSIDFYEGEVVKILKQTGIIHIVRPSETLEQIAKKYDTTEQQIIDINNLKNKRLFIGQKLKIKDLSGKG